MATQSIDRTASEPAHELSTLTVVSSAHLVSHLHIMVLPVLMHLLTERTNASFSDLGLAISAFAAVSALTQAPMGALVDRIGGRIVLMGGLVLGGAAFASVALSSSYAWLIAAAMVAGLANCVYHPADYALLSTGISARRMGRAFSVHTFAGFAGGAIAPAVLLAAAAWGDVNASFIVAGACAWAVAALVFLMPGYPATAPGAHTPAKAAARAAASPADGSLREVLTPSVLGLTLFFTLLGLSGSAMASFAIVALMAGHGVTQMAASTALTAYLAASAAGVLVGGALADRTSRHGDLAAAGFAISALLALAIAVLPLPVPVLVAAMGLAGLVYGIVQPARDMLVRKAAPPGATGRVFGIVSTGFNISAIVGPALFGFLMDQGLPRWIFGSAVVFMLATMVLGLLEERRARLLVWLHALLARLPWRRPSR